MCLVGHSWRVTFNVTSRQIFTDIFNDTKDQQNPWKSQFCFLSHSGHHRTHLWPEQPESLKCIEFRAKDIWTVLKKKTTRKFGVEERLKFRSWGTEMRSYTKKDGRDCFFAFSPENLDLLKWLKEPLQLKKGIIEDTISQYRYFSWRILFNMLITIFLLQGRMMQKVTFHLTCTYIYTRMLNT